MLNPPGLYLRKSLLPATRYHGESNITLQKINLEPDAHLVMKRSYQTGFRVGECVAQEVGHMRKAIILEFATSEWALTVVIETEKNQSYCMEND